MNDIGTTDDSFGGGWEADDAEPPTTEDQTGDADASDESDSENDAAADGGDTEDHGRRGGREQALRRRAQAAEAERDQLRDQLDAMRADVINDVARQARVDPRLLVAAGHTAADFVGDDGRIDRAAVAEACTAAAQEFGVQRGIAALPHGRGGGVPSVGGVKATIDKALGRTPG